MLAKEGQARSGGQWAVALLLSLLLSLLLIERSMERKEVGRSYWFYGGLAAITVGVLVPRVGMSGRKSVVYPYKDPPEVMASFEEWGVD